MTDQIIAALKQAKSHPAVSDEENSLDSSFFAEYTLPPSALALHISGLGDVSLPPKSDTIKRMLEQASAAKFGLREQTLLDKSVRDTAEITAEQIEIHDLHQSFPAMLDHMRASMGLAPNAKLSAHLHNLLIYGPGQFFKPHQDSEKLPGMVASLVLVLPSPHIGGDLLIQQGAEKYCFASENLADEVIKCIAFYADCQHEITPVKQGYRLALTYNLVLENSLQEGADTRYRNQQLEQALKAYFAAAETQSEIAVPRYRPKTPAKLIYFLDHSYSEHSLRWDLLKGSDAQHGQAFLCAAEQLDLIPLLAFVDSHHSWTAEYDRYGNNPKPSELIDQDFELSHWVACDNQKLNFQTLSIYDEDEICWTTESGEDDLTDSEHEGWTGNAGNTIDYWYRRAALVLWQAKDHFAMQFMLSYDEALTQLSKLCESAGNAAQIRSTILQAGTYFQQGKYANAEHFQALASIAVYMQDAEFATRILSHFAIADIALDFLPALFKLQQAYGEAWCLSLFDTWQAICAANPPHRPYQPSKPAIEIDQVVREFLSMQGATSVATKLAAHYVTRLVNRDAEQKRERPIKQMETQAKRNRELEIVLRACSAVNQATLSEQLIEHVLAHEPLYPEYELAEIVLRLAQDGSSTSLAGFNKLRVQVAAGIARELHAGMRQENDWSFASVSACACQYCQTANAFLQAKDESSKVWPLAEVHRRHVIDQCTALGLALSFEVKKQGSPHKLIISKSAQIFPQAQARFAKLRELELRLGELH